MCLSKRKSLNEFLVIDFLLYPQDTREYEVSI